MSSAVAAPPERPLHDYYLLVQPWSTYVKDAATFHAQGGKSAVWGRRWRRISAPSIEAAREIGEAARRADADSRPTLPLPQEGYDVYCRR